MAMSADILAIGPFSADIAETLEYGSDRYVSTQPGVTVITYLFEMPGTSSSYEFARLLGITDPWDFNQHKIDPWRVDLDGLRRFLLGLHELDAEEYMSDLEHFQRLRERQFDFHFRLNA
jgi:hypothetical protein